MTTGKKGEHTMWIINADTLQLLLLLLPLVPHDTLGTMSM